MVRSVQAAESTRLVALPTPTIGPRIIAKRSPATRTVWQRRYLRCRLHHSNRLLTGVGLGAASPCEISIGFSRW
jgi:hypothetical protein